MTGAVAERMGGHGSITVAHAGSRADPSDLVDKFNLPLGSKQIIWRPHINSLLDMLSGKNAVCFDIVRMIAALPGMFAACAISKPSPDEAELCLVVLGT